MSPGVGIDVAVIGDANLAVDVKREYDPVTGFTAYESNLRDQSATLSILCLWLPLGCEIQPLTNPRPTQILSI
jgi:hypothetical protein